MDRLTPILDDWSDKKAKNAKWGGPTSAAVAGLRAAKKQIAAATNDFAACLDWREVSGQWTAAAASSASTAGPSVAGLAKASLPRTKSTAYALPRFGPTAAGTCAKVLPGYLEGTSAAFAAGPVADSAVELDVLSTLQRCGDVKGGAAGERMALVRTDAALSGVAAGSADPGVIADSLKAALDAYPADVEKGRSALIQAAVLKLQVAAEATTKARSAAEPSRGSVMVLRELESKIAAVPLPEAAPIAAGVKRSADAVDIVVTKAEAAAEAAATKAEAAREKAELAAASAPGLKYDPSDKVIDAALAYGKKMRSSSIDSFRREWFRRVGVHEATVEFTVATPFFNVALNAYSAAKTYDEISASAAKSFADERRNKFAFYANFLVNSPSDAKSYKTVVKIGDRVVKPLREVRDDCDRVSAGLLCGIDATFAMNEVPADGKVTLVLIRGSFGSEVSTTFDLTQLR